MRSHLALLCLGLALLCATGQARASGAAPPDPGAACARDNLFAEQALFAEAALAMAAPAAPAAALDDEEAGCSSERPAIEDCMEPQGLSAPHQGASPRCFVRFGGAPRAHLRAHGPRPSPLERILAAAPVSRLQAGAPQAPARDGGGSAASAVLAAAPHLPAPPAQPLARAGEPLGRLLPGHALRLERPPR